MFKSELNKVIAALLTIAEATKGTDWNIVNLYYSILKELREEDK